MNKKTSARDVLIDALLALFFALPASYLYNTVLERAASFTTLAVACVASVTFTVLFLHIRAARHALLTAGGLYIVLLLVQLLLPKIALIRLPVYSVNEIMYSKAVPILICVALSIFAYILAHYITFCAFYMLLYVITLAILSEIGYSFSVPVLIAVTASILLMFFRKNYAKFHSRHTFLTSPVKRLVAALLSVAILCTGLYILCTKRPKTLTEPILGRKLSETLTEKLTNSHNKETPSSFDFSDGSFSLSGIGFGSADRLGGNAEPTDEPLIYVLPESISSTGIYLHGAAYVNYTGKGWTEEEKTKQDYSYVSALFVNQINISQKYTTDYNTAILYIHHANNLRTRQLFTPMNTLAIEFAAANQEPPRILSSSGLIPYASKNITSTYSYSIAAKVFTAENLTSDESAIFSNGFYKNYTDRNSVKKMERYVEDIQREYLSLPDKLPERVINLASQITKNCKNDAEKAFAIQKFLTSKENGFIYTLTPGSVPEDRDFADYFLFDTRLGYCTYFASAMTVLLRAAGVPARYTEGFCLTGTEAQDSAGYYILRGSNAHAWCEVFLEGLGFVPFEATPTYSGGFATPTHEKLTPKPTQVPEETPTPEKTESSEPSAFETPTPTEAPITETTGPQPTPVPTDEPEPSVHNKKHSALITAVIISLAVILAVCAVLYFRSSRYVISRVKRSSPDISAAIAYRYLSRRTRLRKGDSETIREFADKVKASDKLSEAQHKSFEIISDMYEQSLYGPAAVREEDKDTIIECIRAFK